MPKTLGAIVNAGLKAMGEPEISSFTDSNIIEQRLIEQANNAKRKILARHEFDWSLNRTTLSTVADIQTDSAKVTNGATTVTSVTSAGVDADSFTGATTSMWWRRTSDKTSYEITAVDTASSPDTLTITPAYAGTTTTAAGYRLFQDTYSISTSDFDEGRFLTYGDAPYGRTGGKEQVEFVSLADIMYYSGGDLHQDTSGKPIFAARIGVDSSDNPRIVLWPFPQEVYVMTLWYTTLYTENTTFATNIFGGDAPEIAYDAVEHYVTSAAYRWDQNYTEAEVERQDYILCLAELLKRENALSVDHSMKVNTFRGSSDIRWPVSRGTLFDTKSSFGR